MATRAEIKAADERWGGLTDDRRVSTHRWLTGQTKKAPEPDPLQMSIEDMMAGDEEPQE